MAQAGDEFMITCLLHSLLTHHNIIQYNARHRSAKSESVMRNRVEELMRDRMLWSHDIL